MRIKFTHATELEVVTDYDGDTERPQTVNEVFSPGDQIEVDVVGCSGAPRQSDHSLDLQFGDGSVAFGVPGDCFEPVYTGKHERGWVFVDDDTEEKVGFAPADAFANADIAVHSFSGDYANDFSVYFRDSHGKLCCCAADDTPYEFE